MSKASEAAGSLAKWMADGAGDTADRIKDILMVSGGAIILWVGFRFFFLPLFGLAAPETVQPTLPEFLTTVFVGISSAVLWNYARRDN